MKIAMKARDELEAQGVQFVDVYYTELKADPVAVLTAVYTALGLEVSPEMVSEVEDVVSKKAGNTGTRHKYTLHEFGLTENDISETFKAYLARFPLS